MENNTPTPNGTEVSVTPTVSDIKSTFSRGPGRPPIHLFKTVNFFKNGAILQPRGKGKPNKNSTYVTLEMPRDWTKVNIPEVEARALAKQ